MIIGRIRRKVFIEMFEAYRTELPLKVWLHVSIETLLFHVPCGRVVASSAGRTIGSSGELTEVHGRCLSSLGEDIGFGFQAGTIITKRTLPLTIRVSSS
jgi:hypothetical protein